MKVHDTGPHSNRTLKCHVMIGEIRVVCRWLSKYLRLMNNNLTNFFLGNFNGHLIASLHVLCHGNII